MSISIAMCTYNGARYLQAQLESIACQTVQPEEIVICDDGSTDATFQIAEKFAQTASFKLRIFRNEQNLGYTKNFEQAIRLCEGELIALSDQDDVWYPHKLAVLSSLFIQDESLGGVFSDGDVMHADLRSAGRTLWLSHGFDRKEQKYFRSGECARVLFRHNVVTGMTLMFRSALRDKLLPIPKSWIHDGWLAFMLVLHSRLYACSDRLVQYRTHVSQQIGAPLNVAQKLRLIAHRGVSAFFENSRTINMIEYEKAALRFDDLTAYLRSDEAQYESSLMAHASAKAGYSRAILSALSLTGIGRVKGVLRHAEDYRRYSYMRAMFRDLII